MSREDPHRVTEGPISFKGQRDPVLPAGRLEGLPRLHRRVLRGDQSVVSVDAAIHRLDEHVIRRKLGKR